MLKRTYRRHNVSSSISLEPCLSSVFFFGGGWGGGHGSNFMLCRALHFENVQNAISVIQRWPVWSPEEEVRDSVVQTNLYGRIGSSDSYI